MLNIPLFAHQVLRQDMKPVPATAVAPYEGDPEMTVFEIHGNNARAVGEVAEGVTVFIAEFALGTQVDVVFGINGIWSKAEIELLCLPGITVSIDDVIVAGGGGVGHDVLGVEVKSLNIGSGGIIGMDRIVGVALYVSVIDNIRWVGI